MKITKSQCERIIITDIKGLDPITVFLEDYGPRQGQITIRCYDEIWSAYWDGWAFTEPPICRAVDGISNRVDRIKGCGNAIVFQVVAVIMAGIKLIEEQNSD